MSLVSPFTASILMIFMLACCGLPIGLAMIGGTIGYLYIAGLDLGTAAEQFLNGMYFNYIMLAVPLFIMAAELMNIGSMTERLLNFCNALVGRFRGGLAQINVVQSLIFAGMSGSAVADAAGSGRMMQNMMTRDNRYTPSYAAALTVVTSVIGPIIPPSIPMIIFALMSGASIGFLFLAGVVPGLLMTALQMGQVAWTARRKNFPVEEAVPLREIPMITWRALPTLFMPVILLGCLYSGFTTPTEAAALAAFYALFISVVLYRSVTLRDLYDSVLSSAKTTTAIGMLIGGSLTFNYVIAVEGVPEQLRILLFSWDLSAIEFLILVNVILIVIGCVLESTAVLLVIVPILIPTAEQLGIDMVHFGVVVVVNVMLGLAMPPNGLLLLIMAQIAGVSSREIIIDTLPFLFWMIVCLGLLTAFPDLSLWLPRHFGYVG